MNIPSPLRCSGRPRGTTTACSALEQTQLALRSPFLDNDFVRTVFRAPLGAREQRCLPATDRRWRRLRSGGFGPIVVSPGTEGRWPLRCRPQCLEFSFKAEYAYDYGMPQWVARLDHLSPVPLERLFLGRHKFYHFRVWYRDALLPYIQDMFLDSRTLSRPYLY